MKLSNAVRGRSRPQLRIIAGNPLAIRESPNGGQRALVVVWNREEILGKEKNPAKSPAKPTLPTVSPQPVHPEKSWIEQHQGALTLISLAINGITVLFVVAFSLGVWNTKLEQIGQNVSDLRGRIDKLEERFGKLEQNLAKIQGKLGSLSDIEYKETARSHGVQAYQIKPISLKESSPPQQVIVPISDPEIESYGLEIKIEKLTQDRVRFVMGGFLKNKQGGVTIIGNNTIELPLKVGEAVELTRGVKIGGMPDLWMVVVDRPSEDTAIVAVGPKTQEENPVS